MPKIRQAILDALSRRGPLTVQEIARSAHCSEMAVRYHLAVLVRRKCAEPVERRTRPAVGRPQVIYALTGDACEELPKQYDYLAAELLDGISIILGAKRARLLLRRIGRRTAERAPVQANLGVKARIRHATRWLNAHGYIADWQEANRQVLLDVHNCPFRQVARAHREVCELDLTMLSTWLDLTPRMTRCIFSADDKCEFVFTPSHLETRTE